MNNANKAYNITIDELLILLAIKKMNNLYGLFDDEYSLPDRRKANEIIFNLNKKGILFFENNMAVVSGAMDEVLESIKASDRVIVLSGTNEEVPEACIYKGKSLVHVRPLSGDNGRIRIEQLSKDALINRIKDSEWGIGGNDSEVMADMDKISDSDIGKGLFELEKNDLCENTEIKNFAIVLDSGSGNKIKQIVLLSKGVDDYIIMEDVKDRVVYPYSKKRTYELIGEILEGKK